MIITIDGPAAAGKGTLSQALALKYNLASFDTGMLYRAVGLDMVLQSLDVHNEELAFKVASELSFVKMMALSKNQDFRTDIGGQSASIVSAHPKVRQALLRMQQDFAQSPVFADGSPADGAVFDGRDTGTVICPHADVKFFITASAEVRAERRHKEFEKKGLETPYEQVLSEMKARDDRDSSRASAPLKPAVDAFILDTSKLTIEEVIKASCEIVASKAH